MKKKPFGYNRGLRLLIVIILAFVIVWNLGFDNQYSTQKINIFGDEMTYLICKFN